MTRLPLKHDTFVVDRSYPHDVATVFAAFSDPRKKARWYAQSGTHEVVSYDLEFTVQGHEILVGRMGPDTPVAGQIITWTQTFVEIVDEQHFVCTQTVDVAGRRISCALITVQFGPQGLGSTVKLTHQAVFMEPSDGPEMRRAGWAILLDALSDCLA